MYILKRFFILQAIVMLFNYILFMLFYGLGSWNFNPYNWPLVVKGVFIICNVFTSVVNISFAYATWERDREEMNF